jgi:hypothetical protein
MALLFSYGTLQREAVQLSTFGRLLHGEPDELVGFEHSLLKIEDPEFVATSGKAYHSIVRFNGDQNSRVSGTVFEVSESELARADQYDPRDTRESRRHWRQDSGPGCTRTRNDAGRPCDVRIRSPDANRSRRPGFTVQHLFRSSSARRTLGRLQSG